MMIITEPAVASIWLLGLGWKLYCTNMLQYRSYSIHEESFSSTPKLSNKKKGFAGKVNCYSPYRLYRVYFGKPLNKATLRKEVSGCCRKVGLYEIVGVWRGMVEPINACYSK